MKEKRKQQSAPVKFGADSVSNKPKSKRPKMNSNSSLPALRTVETAISLNLLKQFVEEKIGQFGFGEDDRILNIDFTGLPDLIPMKVKFTKEREVHVTRLNGNKT